MLFYQPPRLEFTGGFTLPPIYSGGFPIPYPTAPRARPVVLPRPAPRATAPTCRMRLQSQVRRPPSSLVRLWRTPMTRLVKTWHEVGCRVSDLEITSWYRSPSYNAATRGAAEFSQHTVGCAMDGKSSRLGQARLLSLVSSIAAANGCTALGSEGTAVHVQALPNGTVRAFAQRQPAAYYRPA